MNRNEFMLYLEQTLIPDLKESGYMAIAHDFETCLSLMDTAFLIQVIRDLHDNIVEDVPLDIWTSHLTNAVADARIALYCNSESQSVQ